MPQMVCFVQKSIPVFHRGSEKLAHLTPVPPTVRSLKVRALIDESVLFDKPIW